MTVGADLALVIEQERRLRFTTLDGEQLWQLGVNLRTMAKVRGLALVIEIRVAGETVFYSTMPGASPNNVDWARRKRNTVELLHTSSYAVGLAASAKGVSLEQESGQPLRDYATHGGSFPLLLEGLGLIGTVTVSGAPQRIDHGLVVEALAKLLGIDYSTLAFV